MTIHAQIKDGIKAAMIAKDETRLTTLRGVSAAFTNEIVAKKIVGNELSDEDAIAVLRRLVKQRKDSIEQFGKAGRTDLVANEEAEVKILDAYLPQLMSHEDIEKIVSAKIAEAGTVDKTKLGQFLGSIMKDLKGKADGQLVKEVVEGLIQ